MMAPVLLLPLGMAPLAAHALGLGELRVTSALGQPLQARIELIGASAAEAELAKVGLASAEEYRRLGVDGSLAGVALHFAVKAGDNGRPYVSVTSYEPVREPYLDFVVEAISPSGQVARHYTVLLDPVGSPPLAPMASPAPVWSAQPAPPERRAPRAFNPFANVGQPRPGATYGPVPPGVTLWTVARRVCPPGADLDAVMAAIVRANPQAFINGDPARLKAGVKLTIPEARELRQTPPVAPPPSSPPAAAEVVASPAPAPAPAAPPTAAAGPVEAPAPAAEVRVLRSEDAEAPAAPVSGTAEAGGASRVQLLEEALDAAQQQNEALQQRLGALEEQIKTLTELVKTAPDSEAGAAAVPGAAGGVAAPAPATPALPAGVAPAPAAAAAPAGGVLPYVLAAAAGLGLGGLLLWRQRRRGRGEQAAPVAATTAEVHGAAPPTQVEWVELAPAAPAPAAAAPTAAAPAASAGESAAPAAGAGQAPANDGFGDPVDTQIDLLAAYVGMGDGASARQVFAEIQRTGTPEQVAQAAAVLARLDA